MASNTWIGLAAAVAQVTTLTLGGTWEANDVINITLYDEAGTSTLLSIVAGSTTISDICTTIASSVNAIRTAGTTTSPFYNVLAAAGTTTVTLTSRTAGQPIYCSVATTENGGGAADSQTISAAITTANSGPNDWHTGANWSSGSVPAASDSVYIDGTSTSAIVYGLYQNTALTLNSTVTLTLLYLEQGHPQVGTLIAPLTYKVTTLDIGPMASDGQPRSSSSIVNLKPGNVAMTGYVRSTAAQGSGGKAPVQISCANASSSFFISGSSRVGLATASNGESATIGTLTVSDTARVTCGSGLTLSTLNPEGGTAILAAGVTSINYGKGDVSVSGAGDVTTATIGGRLSWDSAGTITTLNVAGTGSASLVRGTITNCSLDGENASIDASASGIPLNVAFSNGVGCTNGASSRQVDFGDDVTVTPSAIA